MYRILRGLYPVIKFAGDNVSIKSTELAEAMFEIGLQGTDKEVLENHDILHFLRTNSN